MIFKISFEKRALVELRKLDNFVAKRIIKKIKELKKVYDLELDSGHSHKLVENKP